MPSRTLTKEDKRRLMEIPVSPYTYIGGGLGLLGGLGALHHYGASISRLRGNRRVAPANDDDSDSSDSGSDVVVPIPMNSVTIFTSPNAGQVVGQPAPPQVVGQTAESVNPPQVNVNMALVHAIQARLNQPSVGDFFNEEEANNQRLLEDALDLIPDSDDFMN